MMEELGSFKNTPFCKDKIPGVAYLLAFPLFPLSPRVHCEIGVLSTQEINCHLSSPTTDGNKIVFFFLHWRNVSMTASLNAGSSFSYKHNCSFQTTQHGLYI